MTSHDIGVRGLCKNAAEFFQLHGRNELTDGMGTRAFSSSDPAYGGFASAALIAAAISHRFSSQTQPLGPRSEGRPKLRYEL